MNRFFYLLFLVIPIFVLSQEQESKLDSITLNSKNLFIADYTNQFNVKLELSNDVQKFNIPFNGNSVEIEPNLGLRYGVVLSYKFASVRIGIRPKPTGKSKDEKGDPESFRIKFQLLFDKWTHRLEYNYVKGYYITDKNIVTQAQSNDVFIQFPDLKSNLVFGSSAYKFNDNYSVRSTISQTEIQLKSAGSFIPGLDYWYYSFKGLDSYINKDGDLVNRDNYLESSGLDFVLNLGYFYTFVYKSWYLNGFASPGIGVDFNNTKRFSGAETSRIKSQDLVVSIDAGAGIGYNAEKIFFGASFARRMTNEQQNENKIQFDTSKTTFFVFLGYRFKAPKQISKPIDVIEKKIPILKKD